MKSAGAVLLILGVALQAAGSKDVYMTPRIVGGKPASRGQFPYHVGLRGFIIPEPESASHRCGGALIREDFVLTAAHCLYTNKIERLANRSLYEHDEVYQWIWYVDVYLNRNDLNNADETKVIRVNANPNFFIHPGYYRKTLANDIGLIRLPEPVTLNEYTQTVLLPQPDIGDLVGKSAIATGYGRISDETGENSDILRYVRLDIIENAKCWNLEKEKLCTAGNPTRNICSGDSGGPLVVKNENGENVVVGLSSGAHPQCEKALPAYFTRVSVYVEWIKKHMN